MGVEVKAVCIAVVLALSVSCATFNVAGYNSENRGRVSKLAAFDLSCPEDQIALQDLDVSEDDDAYKGFVNTVGARGCGKRTTYTRAPGTLTRYVRNSEVLQDQPTNK